MEISKGHLRHVMFYEIRKGNSATETSRNLHSVYGEECLSERNCRRLVAKVRNGDLNLRERPKREDILLNLMKSSCCQSLKGIRLCQWKIWQASSVQAIQLLTIINGFVERYPNLENTFLMIWQGPTENYDWTSACFFHSRDGTSPFLDRLVIGEETWIFYENVDRFRQWLSCGRQAKR